LPNKERQPIMVRLGVTDYLEKPIRDLQALASAVEVALRP
jgi:CheY-like chemotaxis protein